MTKEEIQTEIDLQKRLLSNYEELEIDIADDNTYIARGNGFCESKYSSDFLQERIKKIQRRISELERMIKL